MKIIFATQNNNKAIEINALLSNKFEILSLKDINFTEELAETQNTFAGNALQKAEFIYKFANTPCFADDSGLEVDALDGNPGVLSARYAGIKKDDLKNNHLLLKNLLGSTNRKANFKTAICLIINNKVNYFEGVLNGTIAEKPLGNNGFGYDPIFIPAGYTKTLAEFTLTEKNAISHRAIAFNKMKLFLENQG